jgi:hypothetical protein
MNAKRKTRWAYAQNFFFLVQVLGASLVLPTNSQVPCTKVSCFVGVEWDHGNAFTHEVWMTPRDKWKEETKFI